MVFSSYFWKIVIINLAIFGRRVELFSLFSRFLSYICRHLAIGQILEKSQTSSNWITCCLSFMDVDFVPIFFIGWPHLFTKPDWILALPKFSNIFFTSKVKGKLLQVELFPNFKLFFLTKPSPWLEMLTSLVLLQEFLSYLAIHFSYWLLLPQIFFCLLILFLDGFLFLVLSSVLFFLSSLHSCHLTASKSDGFLSCWNFCIICCNFGLILVTYFILIQLQTHFKLISTY